MTKTKITTEQADTKTAVISSGKLTEKEFKVLEFLVNKDINWKNPIHGRMLTKIIFDNETIEKYSFARSAKTVIDTMTFSYLGKMCKKDLIQSSFERIDNYCFYTGHYCTYKGKKVYEDYVLSQSL